MNPLQTFYNQTSMREAVQQFQVAVLRELAADAAVAGESTAGFKDANDAINRSFAKLEEMYGKVPAPVRRNSN